MPRGILPESPHFTDVEMEVQQDEGACFKSCGWLAVSWVNPPWCPVWQTDADTTSKPVTLGALGTGQDTIWSVEIPPASPLWRHWVTSVPTSQLDATSTSPQQWQVSKPIQGRQESSSPAHQYLSSLGPGHFVRPAPKPWDFYVGFCKEQNGILCSVNKQKSQQ